MHIKACGMYFLKSVRWALKLVRCLYGNVIYYYMEDDSLRRALVLCFLLFIFWPHMLLSEKPGQKYSSLGRKKLK